MLPKSSRRRPLTAISRPMNGTASVRRTPSNSPSILTDSPHPAQARHGFSTTTNVSTSPSKMKSPLKRNWTVMHGGRTKQSKSPCGRSTPPPKASMSSAASPTVIFSMDNRKIRQMNRLARSRRHVVLPLSAWMKRHGLPNSPFRSAKSPSRRDSRSRPNSVSPSAKAWTTCGFRRSRRFPIHIMWTTPSFLKENDVFQT